MKQRHNCGKPYWATCCVCDGRRHEPGCTAKKNPNKDCCWLRHKKLHDSGITKGLADASQPMWNAEMEKW